MTSEVINVRNFDGRAGLVAAPPLNTGSPETAVRVRSAVIEDAITLPSVERSGGRRFLEIAYLACLANEEDLSVQSHQRYISLGTEWVAVAEGGRPIGFLAAEIISRDLHVRELAVREELQARLTALVRAETERGLPRRCAMRSRVAGHPEQLPEQACD